MRSRGLVDMEGDGAGWRGGYAVSVTSGKGMDEDGRTIRRMASDEEDFIRLGGDVVEGCGQIVRTTTTEVSIT